MTRRGVNRYPEHGKLETVQSRSQAIGEFLAWLREKGISLGKYEQEECSNPRCDGEDCEGVHVFHQYTPNLNTTLAEFFGIDYDALMREKDKMLEEMRHAATHADCCGAACDKKNKTCWGEVDLIDEDQEGNWIHLCQKHQGRKRE